MSVVGARETRRSKRSAHPGEEDESGAMSDASSHGHVSKNAKGAANAAPGRRPALGELTNHQPVAHAAHANKNAQPHLPVKKQAAAQKHALVEQVLEEEENHDSRQQVRVHTHTHYSPAPNHPPSFPRSILMNN